MGNYVLVVDDNPSDLIITSAYVENEGYIAIQAENGYEALDKISEFEYCLVIVDLQMPKMGGIELIKRLRRVEEFKNASILVTSARKESKDVKLAVQAGATDYLVKPLDSQIFEEKFNRIVGKRAEWNEYVLDQESDKSMGFIRKPLKIHSINEIGVTVYSKEPCEAGENFDIGGDIFGAGGVLPVKVESCMEEQTGFKIKFLFIGVNEEQRKKIRLLCREVWINSQSEE